MSLIASKPHGIFSSQLTGTEVIIITIMTLIITIIFNIINIFIFILNFILLVRQPIHLCKEFYETHKSTTFYKENKQKTIFLADALTNF